MPTRIALLRGINVGGRNKIKMADLRELCASLGFRDVRSLLQSGNLIFETDEPELPPVKARLEARIESAFGFEVQAILRRPAAFESIFITHPFTNEQLDEAGKAAVVFLSGAPSLEAVNRLRESNPGREVIQADGSELFVFYADGMARSKLDAKRIEGQLRLSSTTRNWNTCKRIRKLLEA